MGTLGDRIGRRRLLLLGAMAFGAASVLAAYATSPGLLIGARALLGVAGATLAPSTLSLIRNMFADPRQRTVAISVWVTSFSAGGAIGPLLGGVLLEWFWWGSEFLLAVPVMALLLVLGPVLLPEYRDPNAGRLDLRSAGMSLAGVLLVIWGLKQLVACHLPARHSGGVRRLPVHRAVPAAGAGLWAVAGGPVDAARGGGVRRRVPGGAAAGAPGSSGVGDGRGHGAGGGRLGAANPGRERLRVGGAGGRVGRVVPGAGAGRHPGHRPDRAGDRHHQRDHRDRRGHPGRGGAPTRWSGRPAPGATRPQPERTVCRQARRGEGIQGATAGARARP